MLDNLNLNDQQVQIFEKIQSYKYVKPDEKEKAMDLVQQIVAMNTNEGMSVKAISKKINCKLHKVYKVLDLVKKNDIPGALNLFVKKEPIMKCNLQTLQKVMNNKANSFLSADELLLEYNKMADVPVKSSTTIVNNLKNKLRITKTKSKLIEAITSYDDKTKAKFIAVSWLVDSMFKSKLVIFIDESYFFPREMKVKSWSNYDTSNIVETSVLNTKLSLLAAIDIKGLVYHEVHHVENTSIIFVKFLANLIVTVKQKNPEFEKSDIIFFMDNAAVHKNSAILDLVKEHKIILLFNAPYCPEFNAIESFFSLVKKRTGKLLANSE